MLSWLWVLSTEQGTASCAWSMMRIEEEVSSSYPRCFSCSRFYILHSFTFPISLMPGRSVITLIWIIMGSVHWQWLQTSTLTVTVIEIKPTFSRFHFFHYPVKFARSLWVGKLESIGRCEHSNNTICHSPMYDCWRQTFVCILQQRLVRGGRLFVDKDLLRKYWWMLWYVLSNKLIVLDLKWCSRAKNIMLWSVPLPVTISIGGYMRSLKTLNLVLIVTLILCLASDATG